MRLKSFISLFFFLFHLSSLKAQSCRPTGNLQWIVADSIALNEMPTYSSRDTIYGLFFQSNIDYIQMLDNDRYWKDIPIHPQKVDFLPKILQPYAKAFSYFELGPNKTTKDERNAFTRHLLERKNQSYHNCILEYRIGRNQGCIEIDFSQSNGRYHNAFVQDSIAFVISERSKLDLSILALEEKYNRLDEQRAQLWEQQMELRERLQAQKDLHSQFPKEVAKHLTELATLLDNINYMKQIALREGLAANAERVVVLAEEYAQKLESLKRSRYAARIIRPLEIYQQLIAEEQQLHQYMHQIQKELRQTKKALGTQKQQLTELAQLQKDLNRRLK